MSKAIYEEIIDEIGTQTLARFGLNIFDTSSYAQSVEATRMRIDTKEVYDSERVKNKNRENDTTSHGFLFESLDVGMRNIDNAKNKNDLRYIRHDEITKANDPLVDVSLIRKSDIVKALDGDEVDIFGEMQHKSFESKDSQLKRKSRTKVISKSNDLKGKNKKYMNAEGLKVVVNSDRYQEDINHYKKIIEKSKDENAIKEARMMLEKIEKGMVDYETSKKENARNFTIKTDIKYMAKNSAGVAISGAVALALQTLGSGVLYEIKDYYKSGKSDLLSRISRLFQNVLKSLKDGFINGAGFAVIDILVNVISSCFKTLHTKFMYLWENLRTAAKSVYNAILLYVQGKIKNFQDLIVNIVKSIFSILMVLMAETIDTMIMQYLIAFMPSNIASVLSGVFTIVISATVVVLGLKTIENSLGYIFGVYAELQKSRAKKAEISVLVDEVLPELIKDNERIKDLIDTYKNDMVLKMDSSFAQLKSAVELNNNAVFIESLISINSFYGKKLKYTNFNQFNDIMLSDEPIRF
ncbi:MULTISPECIES: hypothetical protein [unclassified Campylobacter]|uniref:hypothetical protein n=1 Tax=unclassified Campylobacter TaxID=2593542 RepID=UPI0014729163|nr:MULTISPECIES: hypothetical protein [unclassified Campylobacter]